MFTVQIEYGMGRYAPFESCEGFETMDEAYSYAKDAHAYAGRLIQSMDIDSLGDRYDIRLGWDYDMPPVA